jgi:hypothetical protein
MKQLFFILSFFALSVITLFSQSDDSPFFDRIPSEFLNGKEPIYYPEAVVVTSADGYDNYNLGTNFAEPHLSQNPLNPLQYFTAFNTNGTYRTNDGFTWVASTPNFGFTMQGDPVTAYDSTGKLYYQNMYGTSSILGCKVIRSTDNAVTWNAALTGINGVDKNWIAADQTTGPYANYIYQTMTASSGGNFTRSTDFGATYNQTATFSTQSLPGMMVAVGPNVLGGNNIPGGCVYVVTNSGSAFASTYTFYVSTNGGSSFIQKSAQNFSGYVGTDVNGRNSVQNMRTRPYPFIGADNSYGTYRGRLYLIYASNSPAGNGNKPDIFCRYSTDQGATWSSAVKVNDDLNSQNNHQWHPAMWVDKNTGRLFVHWMDTRDTPSSDSAYIYASYSDNGGLTFAPNQRISNAKMKINCSTCGGGGTPRYQGDYNSIVSYNGYGLAVWTDFRAGQFGSFVSYFPDFATTVLPASKNIYHTNDSVYYSIKIPSVKLFSGTATFSATVSPPPSSGSIEFVFPDGNSISSFPDSTRLMVKTVGTVTNGSYTITIQGVGPNGIPVHKRQVTLVVQDVIPVELASFNANVSGNNVNLYWSTATETNNRGFEIERSQNGVFELVGYVPGFGTTTETKLYSFVDQNVDAGNYTYRLKQMDFDGTIAYSSEVAVEVSNPLTYQLDQNYPNPFNPVTNITYSLPSDNQVSLVVYDAIGNEVTVLVNKFEKSGKHSVQFNASNLSSGVYFYTIKAGDFTSTKKLVLMK